MLGDFEPLGDLEPLGDFEPPPLLLPPDFLGELPPELFLLLGELLELEADFFALPPGANAGDFPPLDEDIFELGFGGIFNVDLTLCWL